MIQTGRYGTVKWDADAAGTTLVEIASLNAWTLSMKTTKEDVTCFGDPNKVYVPGTQDISGTVGGFFNASELTLIEAANAAVPGKLSLGHNSNEATILFEGPAYMDADINCSLQAPKITGNFVAAGAWTLPTTALPLGNQRH